MMRSPDGVSATVFRSSAAGGFGGFRYVDGCAVLRSGLCWSVGVQQINFAAFTIGCTFGAVFEIRECVILLFLLSGYNLLILLYQF